MNFFKFSRVDVCALLIVVCFVASAGKWAHKTIWITLENITNSLLQLFGQAKDLNYLNDS